MSEDTSTVLQARKRLVALLCIGMVAARSAAQSDFQGASHLVPYDEETIGYGKAVATDAVARLQARLDRGEVSLKHDEKFGYLQSVLDALRLPRSSQMLVFSKTSFQRERISPHRPRALFFNDDVYAGFIPCAPLLEFAAVDARLGAVFYTLSQETNARPRFVRNDQCLECHASGKSLGVPGYLLRSYTTDEEGVVDLSSGTSLVNHRTPLAERWGGWYVTGSSGGQVHRGNRFGPPDFSPHQPKPDLFELQDLTRFFDPAPYPASGSDIAALLVLEHQTHMHNFITRLHDEATLALGTYGHLNYLSKVTEAFLKYLLFTEETPLTAAIQGSSGFTKHFAVLGPRDQRGRSLRDFDLHTRLFKHPCSYLIYSEAFDALPEKMKDRLYQRLWEILTGQDTSPDFARLGTEDRQAILEILRETKPGMPDSWQPTATKTRSVPSLQAH
jgi:hypothetical protein